MPRGNIPQGRRGGNNGLQVVVAQIPVLGVWRRKARHHKDAENSHKEEKK